MQLRTSTVIGLGGASGGLGTSTLAAAVAGLAGAVGRTVLLVDLSPNGGGLDQLGGCAHEPGLRWPAREEGMFTLRARDLPLWRGVRVLSQRGAVHPAPALGQAGLAAVARLSREHEVTVLDLPRLDHPHAARWSRLCGTVALVAGTSPPQVGAALVARALPSQASTLVLRPAPGCGLAPDAVAQVVGLPLLQQVPHDVAVARAVLDQEWPGSTDGPVRHAAASLLAAATDTAGRAA